MRGALSVTADPGRAPAAASTANGQRFRLHGRQPSALRVFLAPPPFPWIPSRDPARHRQRSAPSGHRATAYEQASPVCPTGQDSLATTDQGASGASLQASTPGFHDKPVPNQTSPEPPPNHSLTMCMLPFLETPVSQEQHDNRKVISNRVVPLLAALACFAVFGWCDAAHASAADKVVDATRGKVADWLVPFLLAALPVVELRGAIPVG